MGGLWEKEHQTEMLGKRLWGLCTILVPSLGIPFFRAFIYSNIQRQVRNCGWDGDRDWTLRPSGNYLNFRRKCKTEPVLEPNQWAWRLGIEQEAEED